VREAPNRTRIKALISTKSFARNINIIHSYRTFFSFLSVSYSLLFKALSCRECQPKCSPKPRFPRRSSHPLSTHKQRTLIQEEQVASTLQVTHPAMQLVLQISETAARYAHKNLPPPRSNLRTAQQHAQPQTGQQISGAGYQGTALQYIAGTDLEQTTLTHPIPYYPAPDEAPGACCSSSLISSQITC
jgi:hypothetical protein